MICICHLGQKRSEEANSRSGFMFSPASSSPSIVTMGRKAKSNDLTFCLTASSPKAKHKQKQKQLQVGWKSQLVANNGRR